MVDMMASLIRQIRLICQIGLLLICQIRLIRLIKTRSKKKDRADEPEREANYSAFQTAFQG